jgi:hypothetical protein
MISGLARYHCSPVSCSIMGFVDKIVQRKWLVPLFAGAAVIFFVVGYSLHRAAEPPDVAAVQRGSQVVDVSVFSSNPQADMDVNVDVMSTHPRT